MKKWQVGDTVVVADSTHPRWMERGMVDRLGDTGGLYIRFSDGAVEYHPWGYDIIREYPKLPT